MHLNIHKNHIFFLLCSLVLVVIATVLAVDGRGIHELEKERISVNGTRPVALAAELLEKKYGWIITYEDPPYTYESELVDITEKVRRDLDKFEPGKAPKVLSPKGGELAFEYEIEPITKRPADATIVVQQLLDTYARTAYAGVFRLDRNGQRMHIIAVASKSNSGVFTSYESVLEASITIPVQKRNGPEMLEAFCAAVSKSSRTPVVLGAVPLNMLYRYHTEAGAKGQKAREFLVNEFDRMEAQSKLSWQLLYSPTMKTYFLNIHRVNG